MAGTEIQSFAKFCAQILPPTFVPRNAKGLRRGAFCGVPWKIYEQNRLVCGIPRSNFTKELAFRSILASGGWHSAVYLSTECQGLKKVARFVAFRGNLSAELGKRLNSSPCHFTSTAPLFVAS
jgi:hypothetical protein